MTGTSVSTLRSLPSFHTLLTTSSWGASISPDGAEIAFVSDRSGVPQLYVQRCLPDAPARVIALTSGGPSDRSDRSNQPESLHTIDPVTAVRWSPDGKWLACTVAPGGGVRNSVWVVRPSGESARLVAGGGGRHAMVGPWMQDTGRLVVAAAPGTVGIDEVCVAVDPETGDSIDVARGRMVMVLDMSADGAFALLRDGPRGERFCVVLDRVNVADHPLLPYPGTGSTDEGLIRPAWSGGASGVAADPDEAIVVYLRSDAGRTMPALLAVGIGHDGIRRQVGVLADRPDAELEFFDADLAGRQFVLVWNVAGRSEVELLDPITGARSAVDDLPGDVVSSVSVAAHGGCAVFTIESAATPREVWTLSLADGRWQRIVTAPRPAGEDSASGDHRPVRPTLERFEAHDGLELSGWLYRARDGQPGPVVLSLHGGPEAQERPYLATAVPAPGRCRHQCVRSQRARIVGFRAELRARRRRLRPLRGNRRCGLMCAVFAARRHRGRWTDSMLWSFLRRVSHADRIGQVSIPVRERCRHLRDV